MCTEAPISEGYASPLLTALRGRECAVKRITTSLRFVGTNLANSSRMRWAKVFTNNGWVPQRSIMLHLMLEGRALRMKSWCNKVFNLANRLYILFFVVSVNRVKAGTGGSATILRILGEDHHSLGLVAAEHNMLIWQTILLYYVLWTDLSICASVSSVSGLT